MVTGTLFFDLESQMEIGIPVELNEILLPFSHDSVNWLPDNRVRFAIDIERIKDFGEVRSFLTIDSSSGESEFSQEELILPDYAFSEMPAYFGIASVDPTNQLVLYSSSGGQSVFDIVLMNIESGNIIWRLESPNWPSLPIPDPYWDDGGSNVLIGADILSDSTGFGFISLSSDGEVQQLPQQPFPLTDKWDRINTVLRSPNGRYIYYHLGAFPQGNPGTGPGVILDTTSITASEICDGREGANSVFYGGKWISEDLFLYRVKTEDEKISLRVLDLPSWTTQILTDIIPKEFYGNAYGWTSVEFLLP